MGARPRSWWQRIKRHRVVIGVVAIVLVVVITLIIAGYWFDWTGFNGYNRVTIAHIISGTNAGTVTKTEEYQPGKALWDWLNLLGVLAIPAVVGLGAAWYTAQQGKVSDRENSDNQRETAFQAYIDKMSELLLHENLRHSDPDAEVRKIARVWTLTVLPRLDGYRKGSVIQFLYESGLIEEGKSIIDLSGADLSKAVLSGLVLTNANLSRTILIGANLMGTQLMGANLSKTTLIGALLTSDDLTGVNLADASISLRNLAGKEPINTILYETNLTNANLSGARLNGSDLRYTNLTGADLTGTEFAGALVTEEQLKKSQITQRRNHA